MRIESRRPYIDISVRIAPGMVHWPGDPEIRIERITDTGGGDAASVSQISMGSHTGTHVDAPCHFLTHGICIDSMPLDALTGPARVINIEDRESVKPEELVLHDIGPGERILLKTANSSLAWNTDEFMENFVHITPPAAEFLVEMGVLAIGIDYLSVGGYHKNGPQTHRSLLSAGIWILEGLDLSKTEPGRYDLVCLPLKIAGGDGAPARAVLFPPGTVKQGGTI